MRYFGKILRADWTDLAIVLGPNVRWVEDDYEDLNRFVPEVLLGYCVRLMVPDSIQTMQGIRLRKLVIVGDEHVPWQASDVAKRTLYFSGGGVCEYWDVHRVRGAHMSYRERI